MIWQAQKKSTKSQNFQFYIYIYIYVGLVALKIIVCKNIYCRPNTCLKFRAIFLKKKVCASYLSN